MSARLPWTPWALGLALVVGCGKHESISDPAPSEAPRPRAAASASETDEPAPTAPLRYVALGDSFTAGTGASAEDAFPVRLAAAWRAKCAVDLTNLGVAGYTTDDLLARELAPALDAHPDWVTVGIGANDIMQGAGVAAYQAKVRVIFAQLQRSGMSMANVIVLPQPNWSATPRARRFGKPAQLKEKIDAFNDALEQAAREAGAHFVDLRPLFAEQARAKAISRDGLHPTGSAYGAWADALATKVDGCRTRRRRRP